MRHAPGSVLSVRVLGIDVDDELVDRWRGWLMPARQPFWMSRTDADRLDLPTGSADLDFETLDAFELYGTQPDRVIVWLDRSAARRLSPSLRGLQPARHRWPTSDPIRDRERAIRFVEFGRRRSLHLDVSEATWEAASTVLPGARSIAGTFSPRSGPNCFGAVMAAAGVAGAADVWMQLAPFEQWLAASTVPGGDDAAVGTVLVWRTDAGDPAHAAVTLGEGWLLHKPSQGWMSPTKVLTVDGGKYSARQAGRHLHRYHLR